MSNADYLRGTGARANVLSFRGAKTAVREIVIDVDAVGKVSAWVDADGRLADVTMSLPRWRIEGGRRVMTQPTLCSILNNGDRFSRAVVAAAHRAIGTPAARGV